MAQICTEIEISKSETSKEHFGLSLSLQNIYFRNQFKLKFSPFGTNQLKLFSLFLSTVKMQNHPFILE